MSGLATYLINLEGSDDRLAGATTLLDGIGLPFERLAAFDGRGIPADRLPDYDPAESRRRFGRHLSGGEVGCYQSHLAAAGRFLASEARFGLVLEDDLGVTAQTAQTLRLLLSWLETQGQGDWDIANLGAPVQRYFLPVAGFPGDNALCRAFYFPVTTTAILWSRAGAEAFVTTGRPILMPVDHYFRKWACATGRGLAFREALFPDRQEASEINAGAARQKTKRHWSFVFHRQAQLLSHKLAARRSMNRYQRQP